MDQRKKTLRKPGVENKYGLTVSKIEDFVVVNKDKLIRSGRVWRNELEFAWCFFQSVGNGRGLYGGEILNVLVEFYDQPQENGKSIKVSCSYIMEDMCDYPFEEFFKEEDMETNWDLELQEVLLAFANFLLDEGIVIFKNIN